MNIHSNSLILGNQLKKTNGMKRSVKIILIILALLLASGAYFGYKIYQSVMGSEPLFGKQENIPVPVLPIPPVTKGSADWTNWRGPNFEGKCAFKGIRTDWSKGLKKLWSANYLCQDNATASWSSPVVQGNRLIVPGRDSKNDWVFCINAETGELIWKSSYAAESGSSHGPGPRATPFINDDKVYTLGRSGDLVCWNLEDGKLIWRKNVKDEGGTEPTWGFSTTPLVFGDKVIVQGGGKALVLAYHKLTGELLWKSMEGEAGYAAAITMNLQNELKLLIYHGTGLSCLNPSDGKSLWTAPWPTKYFVNATTPLVSNDIIFHSSGYGMGCEALKVTSEGFSVLWRNNLIEAQHSDPVLVDGYIYGYSGESSRINGQFKCVELASGKEMWSTGEIGQGTTTYVDGYLICLDIKGNLFLVQPNSSGFKQIGKIKAAIKDVKNPAWTVPVIANGKIYLRYLQQMVCYSLTE
jgi:outer membrane protein assembly factor BamB